MLEPDFDPQPTAVRIYRCGYVSRCKKRRCPERATLVAEKIDSAGRHVRQIELCDRHAQVVIARERGARLRDIRSSRFALKKTGQREGVYPLARRRLVTGLV
jgi:hypothetical protein